MRRGSALLMVLMTIAALSIMVMSFVYEARQQSGINVYVRERNRANRLIEAGKVLAEVVLTSYKDAPEWSEDLELDKILEDEDRWVREKMALKQDSKCTIGPILLDDSRGEDGEFTNPSTVTIEITTENSGSEGILNINQFYKGGDEKYQERWWMVFRSHNIPEEFDTEHDGRINLWNTLIAAWNDWRDEDNDDTQIDGEDTGAEKKWYEDYYEDEKVDEEDRRYPRNGPIPDIRELAYVRGFREWPAILTGGVLNPWERKDDQITVRGIMDLFTTEGSGKIDINNCNSIDALVTVPGIYEDPDQDESYEEAKEIAQLILGAKAIMPEDRDVDESLSEWAFKDWNDILNRVDEDIGDGASQYFQYGPDEQTIFKVKITGESLGMIHEVRAEGYVKDGKVRYIQWREE